MGRKLPYNALKGVSTVLSGILITLTIGSGQCYGNIAPYFVSYIRKYGSPSDLTYMVGEVATAVAFVLEPFFLLLAGFIENKIGCKMTVLVGAAVVTIGQLLTAFAIQVHFIMALITYGVAYAIGLGLTFGTIGTNAASWIPDYPGTASGLANIGLGVAPFFLSPLQLFLINPEHVSPNQSSLNAVELYYEEEDILQRVPTSFLQQAALFAVLQVIGYVLFFDAKAKSKTDEENTDQTAVLVSSNDVSNFTASAIIMSKEYWMLTISYCMNIQVMLLISMNFKTYGSTFIRDETFLTLVGSFSSLFGGLGRMFGGVLMDKMSFKTIMTILCLVGSCSSLVLGLNKDESLAFLYLISVCYCICMLNALVTIYTIHGLNVFKCANTGIPVGLINVGYSLGMVVVILLGMIFVDLFGWTRIFVCFATMPLIGLLLVCCAEMV